MSRLRERARRLKAEAVAISLAVRDPRTPWPARLVAVLIVAYVLSPLDLIPDIIPVLGFLDEIVLMPAAIALVVGMIPDDVMTDCRSRAEGARLRGHGWLGAAMVVAVWAGVLAGLILMVQ